jgi:hypothetical protein
MLDMGLLLAAAESMYKLGGDYAAVSAARPPAKAVPKAPVRAVAVPPPAKNPAASADDGWEEF